MKDDTLIVLEQAAGAAVGTAAAQPARGGRSVFDDLKSTCASAERKRPFVVHRIDRDTSGLVLFAKSADAQEMLKAQFKRHTPSACILRSSTAAIAAFRNVARHPCVGHRVADSEGNEPKDPRGKEAICHYRLVESLKGASVIEVTLVTGRRNQIRIQARLRGHTLIGEQRYIYGPDALRTVTFRVRHCTRGGWPSRIPMAGRYVRGTDP